MFIILVWALSACGANPPNELVCAPGTTNECLCAPGQPGIQICNSAGSGFDSCECAPLKDTSEPRDEGVDTASSDPGTVETDTVEDIGPGPEDVQADVVTDEGTDLGLEDAQQDTTEDLPQDTEEVISDLPVEEDLPVITDLPNDAPLGGDQGVADAKEDANAEDIQEDVSQDVQEDISQDVQEDVTEDQGFDPGPPPCEDECGELGLTECSEDVVGTRSCVMDPDTSCLVWTQPTLCDDNNACTTDSCNDGVCGVGDVVICASPDQCHEAGLCDPLTGVCSNPIKSNGSPCDDSDLCTQMDTCQSGVCTGDLPKSCFAIDSCHAEGECIPATGECTNPEKPDGSPCFDGSLCTQIDQCTDGVCTGSVPVQCIAQDDCHEAGICIPTSGECTNPIAANGTSCNDNNGCTQEDTCSNGTCIGANNICNCSEDSDCAIFEDGNQCNGTLICDKTTSPFPSDWTCALDPDSVVVCPDDVCNDFACEESTGACLATPTNDGFSCDDDNPCTLSSACDAGECAGTEDLACPAPGICESAGTCQPETGECTYPPGNEGGSCDDSNMCTSEDVCTAGTCGGTPLICESIDDCHEPGICAPETGVCSTPPKPDGALCDDGSVCTGEDACTSGVCGGTPVILCNEPGLCEDPIGTCDPISGECSYTVSEDGTECEDESECTHGEECMSGACIPEFTKTCTSAGPCEEEGYCDTSNGACIYPLKADGASCDDGNTCSNPGTCIEGGCNPGDPIVCEPMDQCHEAGICDPAIGFCSNPQKVDGALCDDGNLCTGSSSCLSGACTGAELVECPPPGQCQIASVCNPATGECDFTNLPDGTLCDDNSLCTENDACVEGACVGETTISCTAGSPCMEVDCNPLTGECSQHPKIDGLSCDDGDLCTEDTTCMDGVCGGGVDFQCTALDDCHVPGFCNPETGECSNPNAEDGILCDDNSLCSTGDFCQAGECIGAENVVCEGETECMIPSTCNPETGGCESNPKADGTPCDDADLCSASSNCQAGECIGFDVIVCEALSPCHDIGSCDPDEGFCSNPPKDEGALCDDNDLCTQTDLCEEGICKGVNEVECTALSGCHNVGVCDPLSGTCSNPAKSDGVPCDDGTLCSLESSCVSGECTATDTVDCPDATACTEAGVCDPSTGLCEVHPKINGIPCDDEDACSTGESCMDGNCGGGEDVVCEPLDDCHIPGACNPETGVCSNPPKDDGAPCDDGSLCSITENCIGGSCTAMEEVNCPEPNQCQTAAFCDAVTGECSFIPKEDGTSCNDANPCTQSDTCQAGACVGSEPVVCEALTSCHNIGICIPDTGECTNPPKENGSDCDDGNACTDIDFCKDGECEPGDPVVCTALDQCHMPGFCDPENGGCSNPPAPNGMPCDDESECTQNESCDAGTCTPETITECPGESDCLEAGTCNPGTGFCEQPPKVDGIPCDDEDACSTGETCLEGNCGGGEDLVCEPLDDCHIPGICDPASGVCSNPQKDDGAICDDGSPCSLTEECSGGECTPLTTVDCPDPGQCQVASFCDDVTGECNFTNKADGTSCDDGNLCTTTDSCQAGACVGAEPVVCTALDQCHLPGFCAPDSGECTNPPKENGSDCDDENACTDIDFCKDGTCESGDPVVCTALDQCHMPGFCDPANGGCSNPPAPNGLPCDDENECTQGESCDAGTCTPATTTECPDASDCLEAGICNSATGFCEQAPKENGTVCDDGDACSTGESCNDGNCGGGEDLVCESIDDCHIPGICDPATGVCSNPPKEDGAVCDDGSLCSLTEECTGGVCTPVTVLECPEPDQCQAAVFCDAVTGECNFTNEEDGTDCDDGNLCTTDDSCQSGVCVGSEPVVCTALSQCHNVGICIPETGICDNPPKENGADCDDGNGCTVQDFCKDAACEPGDPIVCTALDDCHQVGTCNEETGFCTNPAQPDDTVCDDGSLCSNGETCQAGICTAASTVSCPDASDCLEAGICNDATGFCEQAPKENGITCDDGDACSTGETCNDGNCGGGADLVCEALDDCHIPGTCDSATGVCSNPPKEDGAVCDDGSLCSLTEECTGGICTPVTVLECPEPNQCQSAVFCDAVTGECNFTNEDNGTTCDDGNLCTTDDSCLDGVCVGSEPVVCTALSQCHNVGVCIPETGICDNPPKENGADCDDGNGCTVQDFCKDATCEPGDPIVCTALDDCHQVGTCNEETGFCTNPAQPDDTICDDGSLCSNGETCQAGICTAATTVSCPDASDCLEAGICNDATGFCEQAPKENGIVCDDGDACSTGETCNDGNCGGGADLVCEALDDCHIPGFCDPATGACSNPPKEDGTVCDDGSLCSLTEECTGGICTPVTLLECPEPNQCQSAVFCDAVTGECNFTNEDNGTTCDDGNLCTTDDSCLDGVCVGSEPVVCTALSQCHNVGVCAPETGICDNPPKENGADCDDGNGCTVQDFCKDAACEPGDPIVCTALDDCHQVGTCNEETGFCTNPAQPDDTICDDGSLCSNGETCQAGICTAASTVSCPDASDCLEAGICNDATGFCEQAPKENGIVCDDGDACSTGETCNDGNCGGGADLVCEALDDCHIVGTCDSATGICSNPPKADGAFCDDGSACSTAESCEGGICTVQASVTCPEPDQCQATSFCDPDTGECQFINKEDGTVCDDGNLCTSSDTCQAGSCVGATPIVCEALSQCHDPGLCSPETGICSNPPKDLGEPCDDGNECTINDVCISGSCDPGDPVVCTALDDCHQVGTCNEETGFCTNPAQPDGTICDDGSLCSNGETCAAGVCTPASTVSCPDASDCLEAGVCNDATGFCEQAPKENGTICDDGDACSTGETCANGNCGGGIDLVCEALSNCHIPGTCDTATGVCSNPPKENGAGCDDGSACSITENCQDGVCTVQDSVTCPEPDQCQATSFCDPATGDCNFTNKEDGTACDDGNLCTTSDSCQAGNCVGTTPVVCEALSQCHNIGICIPGSGLCTNPPKETGAACADGNACTVEDFCLEGACEAGDPAICTALDDCHQAGVCDEETGFCTNPAQPDGTVCNDGSLCSHAETCQAGTCTPTSTVSCPEESDCLEAGVCNDATGFCEQAPKTNGTICDDGDACSTGETCANGNCGGGVDLVCEAVDDCHIAGICDSATGVCSNPPKADGAICDDGSACSTAESCVGGICTVQASVTCPEPDQCQATVFCDPATGECNFTNKVDGAACDDGNLCTTSDSCQAGSCVGTTPIVCEALSQCHDPGLCSPETGICSNPPKDLGESCDDGNACTVNDVCISGTCDPGDPVVCTALDQCHEAGVCDESTGFCTNPAQPDGTTCDDGSLCSNGETCQTGICTPDSTVTCPDASDCLEAGICNDATGFCEQAPKTNGTLCDDGDACSTGETCANGTCGGGEDLVCTALDQCHIPGTCDSSTGLCSNPPKADGAICDDGSACSTAESCVGGICTVQASVTCPEPDQCQATAFCDPTTGDCNFTNKEDGTSCDDGNLCTTSDSCQAGSCVGTTPIVCEALSQCHDPGLCSPETGICSNPPKDLGASCDDGNACTVNDVCISGSCDPGDPVVCTALDDCHQVGVCNEDTGFCTNPIQPDGTTCDDGSLCSNGETCQTGTCTPASTVSCPEASDCLEAGVCNDSTGFCEQAPKTNGITCDDGDACSTGETCANGTCGGGEDLVCTALDQCHLAGTCDSTTGACSNPFKPDGTICDDGSACSTAESCQSGECTVQASVTCPEPDQCQATAFCDPVTGECGFTNKVDGAACDDGNLCTTSDSCQSGSCVGDTPVVCEALSQCHDPGLCSPETGICSNPPKDLGASCDDGNACTVNDVCISGSCDPGDAVVCTALDQCHEVGVCDVATGFCSNPPKADDTVCDDGSLCSNGETCQTGTCTPASTVSCPEASDCLEAGVCNDSTGFCEQAPKTNGITCDDGDACSTGETCANGTCGGGEDLVCTALDQCHLAGTCDSTTGACSNPFKPDGTICDDGSACSTAESCQSGDCIVQASVTCPEPDQCQATAFCDPVTGECGFTNKADGTTCDDGNLCTASDTCQAGSCVGSSPVVCEALSQCHDIGVCAPETGLCDSPVKALGSACDDSNACTVGDVCIDGSCDPGDPIVCTALDQCHEVGVCNVATGICSNPPEADGTVCDDGSACNENDRCVSGICTGENQVVCPAPETCQQSGVCNAGTGLCVYENKPDFTICDNGDACTTGDYCSAGTCMDGVATSCPAGLTCTPVSYEEDVKPILQTYCSGCHDGGASGGHNIASSYDDSFLQATTCSNTNIAGCSIERITNGTMPPSGPGPSEEELAILQDWFDRKQPETKPCTPIKDWTVMIYMMADNNLEFMGLDNIDTLMGIGSSADVNIILEVDWTEGVTGTKPWRAGDITAHERWEIGSGHWTVIEALEETSAGPDSLSSFLTWGTTAYPAKRYSVVLWDHGSGWTFGEDVQPAGQAYMSIEEIATAFNTSITETGIDKYDLLVFYACLMASYETVVHLEPFANFLLASQALTYGFRFNALSNLVAKPIMGPKELGETYVDLFLGLWPGWTSKLTISLLDLTKAPALKTKLETFADEATDVVGTSMAMLNQARAESAPFSISNSCPDGVMQDLWGFAESISNNSSDAGLQTAANELEAAIEDMIVSMANGPLQSDVSGISIYLPTENCFNSDYNSLSKLLPWQTFLQTFHTGTSSDTTPPTMENNALNQVGDDLVWTGEFQAVTATDLQSLRFDYIRFENADSMMGGFYWYLGSEPVTVAPDLSYSHTYNGEQPITYQGASCGAACTYSYVRNKYAEGSNSILQIPLYYHTSSPTLYVDWRASYDPTLGASVDSEYYAYSLEGGVSALFPEEGSLFRTASLTLPAVRNALTPATWNSNNLVAFNAQDPMKAAFLPITPGTNMLYTMTAKDTSGNISVDTMCSGAPDTYYFSVTVQALPTGTPWDLEDEPDFKVRMWRGTTGIHDTPSITNADNAVFTFMDVVNDENFYVQILEEDGTALTTVYQGYEFDNLITTAQTAGSASSGGVVFAGTQFAYASFKVIKCIDY